jgi:cholesterol oxidase
MGDRASNTTFEFDMDTIETGPSDNVRDSEMWSRSWTQFRVDRRSAEQVIVAAHAYGSSKLLHHMQHKGRLTGLSDALEQRARTNSEQLLVVTRPHKEWKRDPARPARQ